MTDPPGSSRRDLVDRRPPAEEVTVTPEPVPAPAGEPEAIAVDGLPLLHAWCGRPIGEHPTRFHLGRGCPFPPLPDPEPEFPTDTEPRIRVVGLPETSRLPAEVLAALDNLARVCRSAFGMGVEVYGDEVYDEVRTALDLIRRRLDL